MEHNTVNTRMSEERLKAERDFHDIRFAQGGQRGQTGKFYSIAGTSHDRYRELIVANARGKRVLEYGCGADSEIHNVAPLAVEFFGIDISPVAIEQAEKRANTEGLSGSSFRVMNAESLNFPESRFESIFGMGILHHLDLVKAFAELARVMTPNGTGVFIEPLGHNPAINLYRRATPGARTVDEHPLLMADFQLARHYFNVIDIQYFYLSTLAAVALRRTPVFEPTVRVLNAFDKGLFALMPFTRRYAWMVVVTLRAPNKKAS
jgi:SAM-dependent methyltransferase